MIYKYGSQIVDKTLFRYPISVISDIGLSLTSESPISDWESEVWHYIGYRNKVLSNIPYSTSPNINERCHSLVVPLDFGFKGLGFESYWRLRNFCKCQISEWTLMSRWEHFRYRTDSFQSDIFFSDIRLTDVDVGYIADNTIDVDAHLWK